MQSEVSEGGWYLVEIWKMKMETVFSAFEGDTQDLHVLGMSVQGRCIALSVILTQQNQ